MSARELVVLGTASQVPTRHRNHNGYLLRWDGEGLLFDPGEGTQRQMLLAGVSTHALTRICVTHFHGDHCLGLPGILQRISLDRVPHPVAVHYPASGQEYFERLRYASAYYEQSTLVPLPVHRTGPLPGPGPGPLPGSGPGPGSEGGAPFTLEAAELSHPVPSFGYALTEPNGRRIVPELLRAAGLAPGPAVGVLQRDGRVTLPGQGTVTLEQVSEVRRGQRAAFIMDTRLCPGVHALARDADLLVIEATFTDEDAALAQEHGHLTAGQAGRVAAEAGARTLVLTHFSQRYPDLARHHAQAAAHFDGDIVVAEDLLRVPVPPRR